MHIEQRLEFLDSLPSLPTISTPSIRAFAPELPIDPSKASGTVGKEMVNLFMEGVSIQNRKDVNNCKQLVQNAATKLYDPQKELFQWYKYYVDTMQKLGWVIQSSQIKEQTIKRSGLTMDTVALYVMQGFVGANITKLAELAGKGVANIKNSDGLVDIYNSTANVGSDAKFDMSPIWETKEGYPMMILNCNSLNVSESSRGILWWKSTTQETKIKTAAQAVYLNVETYGAIRQGVLDKISKNARDALAEIPDMD
ncbi:hypothetical protein [Pseudomonas umsongensis]|jgi:hypothetical protein|uniref:hypothetical protein n=1 Tax=Pseudomonas umsongensis TaxID=198618 RepID=UPI0015BACCB0|nr:hypothetical protein [Pseudomonas umsongensis]NWL23656.1 hypothetical protein [Pseudomonas umsongensis]